MKFNITIEPLELNGYTNISPLKGMNILAPKIEPNSAREIILECMDVVPVQKIEQFLALYISKLRHGGTITLCGTSASLALKALFNDQIDIVEYNKLAYGNNAHPWDIKRGLYEIDFLKTLLLKHKLKIEIQSLNGLNYIISGVRE